MHDMSEAYREVLKEVRNGGSIAADLLATLCGRHLGSGVYRKTFLSEVNKEQVVKIETESGHFCNVTEWDIWENLKEHKVLSRWMAPVRYISPNGAILIQDRTYPVHVSQMPEKIPRLFCDTKIQNWGWYEGRIVCHDYGNHRLYNGGNIAQLVKADWWGQNY